MKTTPFTLLLAGALVMAGCAEDNNTAAGLTALAQAEAASDGQTTSGAFRRIVAATDHPEAVAVIRGQVNFTGNPPAEQNFKITGDKFCEEVNSRSPIRKRDLALNEDGTIADVVVWVAEGGPDWLYESAKQPLAPVVMMQENCQFFPRVVALQTGQHLVVKNADPTLHNVNAQPQNNPRLNKALFPNGDPAVLTFEKPEMAIKLKSDIHPWIEGWAAVFSHSAFAVTGEDGRFEISGLPPGEYVLNAWQERFGTVKAHMLVRAETPAHVIFTYTNQGSKGGMQVDADGNPTTGTLQQEEPGT